MTIKPTRTSTPHAAGTPRLPAPMMTIPDFCWQPAMVARMAEETSRSVSCREEPCTETPAWTKQPVDFVTSPVSEESSPAAPEPTRRDRPDWMRIGAEQIKTGLKRHWLPAGGIAVALLWVGSLLLTGGAPPDDRPMPEGPRQARRDSTLRRNPLAKSQLHAPAQATRKATAAPTATEENLTSSPAVQAQDEGLFERVPPLSKLPTGESPEANPRQIPDLNPPSGPPADGVPDQLSSPPWDAPTTTEDPRPERSVTNSTVGRTVQQPAAAHRPPVGSDPPVRRETEYEWGTPNLPVANSLRNQGVAQDPRTGAVRHPTTSSEELPAASVSPPAYRETDPASYKDPLYEIPPLARRPHPTSSRR